MDSGCGFSVLQLACWMTLDKLHFEAHTVLIMMELSNINITLLFKHKVLSKHELGIIYFHIITVSNV